MEPESSFDYNLWIKNLKVGDKVCVEIHSMFPEKFLTEVTRITPTGKIRVKDRNLLFDSNGNAGGGSWTDYTLVPITPELTQEFEEAARLSAVKSTDFKKLHPDKIKKIYNIIYDKN